MKRKILLLVIVLVMPAWQSFCQEDRETPPEGYIKYAVPPFDNRTKKLDMSKLEVWPLKLYKASPQNPPQQRIENNMVIVTDNADVQAFPSTNAQSEQHMTVSKINPNNIILSSNTPFYQGYYVSQNGGTSWFGSDQMPDGVQSYGDPATAFNDEGHIFFETMAWGGSGYKVYSSTNQGTTWGAPVTYSYSPVSFDKEMMAIDNLPGSPYLGNIYTAWTDFGGTPYVVKFNRSVNGGASYLPNINLQNSFGQGTNVQTGPNGEVYVCWANYGTGAAPANGIGFTKSLDGGATFTNLTPVFSYLGIRPDYNPNPLFNNTRVADFPSMAVDKSCAAYRGRIYIAYPGHQGGIASAKAVILVRHSDNQGTTWSAETEVSISAGRQNWFPWITVDDATGTVSVAYLTLDQATGFITNTYLAYSFDGGFSWSNIKVSDVGHTVAAIPGFATGYCGDYIANTAWANKNYVSWNDNRTGQWQNYVSRIDLSELVLFSSSTDFNILGPLNYSLPTATYVQYQSPANINSPVASTFIIQPGARVAFFSGGSITLNPGFLAIAGSRFDARHGTWSGCVNSTQRDEVSEDIMENFKNLKPAYSGDATVQFSMYPNPAGNEINFEYLLPDPSDVTLTLMDLNGREVKILIKQLSQAAGLNRYKADISVLKNGVYTYRLVTAGYVKTGKFVKAE